MKFEMRYFVILLLLAVALPVIVIASSSNVTATGFVSTPTPTPTTVPSFYDCVFGVHIFGGADPVGSYSVNINSTYSSIPTSGTVSGQVTDSSTHDGLNGMYIYLGGINGQITEPYLTRSDINGNYAFNNVQFGRYLIYITPDQNKVNTEKVDLVGKITLSADNPNVVASRSFSFP
jgi:hypothetical protein